MPVNVEDKIKRLGAAQREKVEARAAELITEPAGSAEGSQDDAASAERRS